MTDLDKAKIAFANESINLEIAQGKYNEAKQRLVQELHKEAVGKEVPQKPLPTVQEGGSDTKKD